MRIILSGGGTGGSVSPLIAIFEEIKKQHADAEFLWLATRNGPEKKLIASYGIAIKEIAAGKFRRYFSLMNFFDPFLVVIGFFQSLWLINKFKPQAVISAGGFVSVPVVWAAWVLGRPALIHQQDVIPGLANKLMARFANIITVTFEKSLADFPRTKTTWTGNPVRPEILLGSKEEGYKFFKINSDLPVILVIGGGTGAQNLNNLLLAALPKLVGFCQVIHLTGGKLTQIAKHSNYHSFDFLTDQLKNAYAAADLVISRAGMSVLTELAALGKPTIIIPMPDSHQLENAMMFFRANAAAMLDEKKLTAEEFCLAVKQLLADKNELASLSRNISKMMPNDAAKKIASMIL